MDMLQRDGFLQDTHDDSHDKCKSCISGKIARKPFLHKVERAKDLLGLIHTDVCGPFRTVSREGASYFITFTDDFSRYGFVYLMKHKHEVFETFNVFQNEVENQLGKKIKAIRSDRGGEYPSHEFVNHMKSCGITLLDMVRSMMNLTTLPKSFWGYALETAACILNMVRTKKVDRTPYEYGMGNLPSYPKETMGYYFYYPLENKIFVSRNAEFFEKSFMIEIAPTEVESQKVEVPIRRSARIPQVPDRYGYYVDVEEYEIGDLNEPPNYKAALADPESEKWLEAMNTEMQSMKDNQVWCAFKARLVAKGFTQTYGVDYGETFSLVAGIRSIRILLAIAAFYEYEIWQMDVKTAFLNGHLSKDIYMVQPERFVDPNHPNKVCKLQRSIYGLKQASRSWNKRFDEEIKKIGFTQNPDEPCVYLKASGSNVAFLVLYVDDILLMGNSIAMLQEVKYWLCKCFSMKDLGEAAYILGIKIIRDRSKRLIALSQSAYMEKTLKKFRKENSKKGYTQMVEKPDYRKPQGAKTPTEVQRMRRVPYASATDDTKSQTGYMFILNGGAVDWKSAKQSTTAMSSIEAEYIAATEASMEAVWMRKIIDGLGGIMP
ncbi:retrotransposon protein, putative, ty1-copia subclass [Tanacetum coccineum]